MSSEYREVATRAATAGGASNAARAVPPRSSHCASRSLKAEVAVPRWRGSSACCWHSASAGSIRRERQLVARFSKILAEGGGLAAAGESGDGDPGTARWR